MTVNKIIQEDIELIFASINDWSRFYGKTILISGASGFLPAYIVETLLYVNSTNVTSNINVIALVRNKAKAEKRFQNYLSNKFLTFLIQDVSEKINVEGKIDVIIHAASQASPKYYGKDPVGTLNANVLGTNNLLNLAYEKGVDKFLYFSSSEVYGQLSPDKIPTSEVDYGYLDPCNVRACYAEGKRMGETMCISWMHQFNVPVSIVRPFHTYGPGMELDDGRVYADFIADVVYGRDIIMTSDGSARRAFCYITDAVIAFFTILQKGENGQAYNMGNNECEISIVELAQKVVLLFPEKNLNVVKKDTVASGYINSYVSRISPNTDKLKDLGWEPKINLESGFTRTIKSYI